MADQPAAPQPEQPEQGGRRLDLTKLVDRLSSRVGTLVQENEALQLLVEDAEAALAAEREANAGLRAELVAATSTPRSAAGGKSPAAK